MKTLTELRKEKGLTQKQLAEAAGMNIRQIQRLESGEIKFANITILTAVYFAKALGIKTDEILKIKQKNKE